ncbi:MAG: hypothetical protein NT007_13095 [Candidatus Kapabacteria bacterium]|nr:hypothetical protein [Candidatus Kapabacteria bacterium]
MTNLTNRRKDTLADANFVCVSFKCLLFNNEKYKSINIVMLVTILIIFQININLSSCYSQYLKLSDCSPANGSWPLNAVVCDGTYLYGTTSTGGLSNFGVVYKINMNGSGYSKLIDFAGASNGRFPYGNLLLIGSTLYGMASAGGLNDNGVIFKINTDGSGYAKLFDFDIVANGAYPNGGLIINGSTLYGMTAWGGISSAGIIFKINTDGTGFTKLFDFNGTNGLTPLGNLTLSGTTLYGMTYAGGLSGFGAVFKINTDASGFAVLLDFDDITNGSYPYGNLWQQGATLYGTTSTGGSSSLGVLFKINTNGSGFAKLYDFTAANGSSPGFGELLYYNNNFYGVTWDGGINNLGVLFKINTDGTGFTKLLDFAGASNGANPSGSLILNGSVLYGITYTGGTSNAGTIYEYQIPVSGNKFPFYQPWLMWILVLTLIIPSLYFLRNIS